MSKTGYIKWCIVVAPEVQHFLIIKSLFSALNLVYFFLYPRGYCLLCAGCASVRELCISLPSISHHPFQSDQQPQPLNPTLQLPKQCLASTYFSHIKYKLVWIGKKSAKMDHIHFISLKDHRYHSIWSHIWN